MWGAFSIEALKKNNSSPHVSGGGGGQPLNPLVFNACVNGQTRGNVWLPGPSIVCCINIVIAESQVEGNGECLCQFGFLTFCLLAPFLVICSNFNNPCQTPNSSLHSAPLLCCCCVPSVPLSLTGQTGSSAFIYPAQREACPAGQILFSSADSPTS